MRITLELDDDLVLTAKQLARQRGATLGHVVSQLMRVGLTLRNQPRVRNGVPLLESKSGAKKPTLELINRLRDS
jgi:hypothetical protein